MDMLQGIKKQLEYSGEFVRLLPTEIIWLVKTLEQLIEENGAMADKHAEKEIAFGEFMRIIDQQEARIENLQHNNRVLAAALNKTQVEYHNYRHKYFDADDQHN